MEDMSREEQTHLQLLRLVFCEAAALIGVTANIERSASKSSVMHLMKRVVDELGLLSCNFACEAMMPLRSACGFVSKGLKCFAVKKFAKGYKYFENVLKEELEFLAGEEAPPDAAIASCVLCRLKMYATLHINDYFLNKFCHLFVIGLEFEELYHELTNSEQVLLCLADEYDPLPSKLPRLASHTHLTRVPLLRNLASLRGLIHRKFWKKLPIKTGTNSTCLMCDIKNLLSFSGHSDQSIYCMCSASYSGLIYWSGGDKVVHQWCTRTNRQLNTFSGHSATVNCLLAIQGACISGSEDSSLIIWNEADGCVLCTRQHEAGVRCLSYIHEVEILVSGGADSYILLWNISDRTNVQLVNTLFDVMPINSVVVLMPSMYQNHFTVYASSGSNSDCSEIRCWKSKDESLEEEFNLHILEGHTGYVLCLLLTQCNVAERIGTNSKDDEDEIGGLLYSSSMDKTIKLWDCGDEHRLIACRNTSMEITCMVVYNNILYTGNQNNSLIHLWDAKSLNPIGKFERHDDAVNALCVEDGRLFSGSHDLSVQEFLL